MSLKELYTKILFQLINIFPDISLDIKKSCSFQILDCSTSSGHNLAYGSFKIYNKNILTNYTKAYNLAIK